MPRSTAVVRISASFFGKRMRVQSGVHRLDTASQPKHWPAAAAAALVVDMGQVVSSAPIASAGCAFY